MDDQEPTKPATRFQLGQDLSSLSIEELTDTIGLLREEIERLEAAKASKTSQMAAAESLFKTNN